MVMRLCAVFLLAFMPFTKGFSDTEKISSHEYYNEISELFHKREWEDVVEISLDFINNFSTSPFIQEIHYFLGISYYYLEDYEFSNDYLGKYLKNSHSPSYFEQAIYHKFLIAERFRNGAKKRIFKWNKAPALFSALEDAIEIYDEVISSYPYHELAAKSLYGKGKIHEQFAEYKDSIATYQILIKRFPKHELAIESFIEIGKIYLEQCQQEHLDPDLLDSAYNNYRKFRRAFPGEKRLREAFDLLKEMKEVFADNLYKTGKFYERTNKPGASIIYYSKAISKFPKTKAAKKSQARLDVLQAK